MRNQAEPVSVVMPDASPVLSVRLLRKTMGCAFTTLNGVRLHSPNSLQSYDPLLQMIGVTDQALRVVKRGNAEEDHAFLNVVWNSTGDRLYTCGTNGQVSCWINM